MFLSLVYFRGGVGGGGGDDGAETGWWCRWRHAGTFEIDPFVERALHVGGLYSVQGASGIVPVHGCKVWVIMGELNTVGEGGQGGGVDAVVDAVVDVAVHVDVVHGNVIRGVMTIGETTWPLAMRVGLVVITPVGILTRDSIEVTGFVVREFRE